jgi:hypothetical protein
MEIALKECCSCNDHKRQTFSQASSPSQNAEAVNPTCWRVSWPYSQVGNTNLHILLPVWNMFEVKASHSIAISILHICSYPLSKNTRWWSSYRRCVDQKDCKGYHPDLPRNSFRSLAALYAVALLTRETRITGPAHPRSFVLVRH